SGGIGTGYTIGDNRMGMDPETIEHARLILLWGTNTLSTNLHLWKFVARARRNGARLIVIDPVRTRTAAQADDHLQIVPGTGAALAVSLLHGVLQLGKEDRDFIRDHTLGFETFQKRVAEWPPARAAALTGLPTSAIERVGALLASTRPTAIKVSMGMQRHA